MDWTRQQVLAVVHQSPARVAEHDKQGWLALFAEGAVVEDPVGARPQSNRHPENHSSSDALARFYEAFIAPNSIRFEVLDDFVAGLEVARDVRIHTRFGNGLELTVPAYLNYKLTIDSDELRILRLAAYWDLRSQLRLALGEGWRGLAGLTRQSLRLAKQMGGAGLFGYTRALMGGIGRLGLQRLDRCVAAVQARDVAGFASLFHREALLEFPIGRLQRPADWLGSLGPDVHLQFSRPLIAGWAAALRFCLHGEPSRLEGIAFLTFDRRSRQIAAARFFADR